VSILDQVVAAVTPPESDEARMEARQKARAAAPQGSWLSMVLDHHEEIERHFMQLRQATNGQERLQHLKQIALILNGHSLAEEVVLYPALVVAGEKAHSTMSYTEHSGTKVQMGELETIDPMSQEFLDKAEHIRGALAHHMYEEENNRFLDLLQKLPTTEHQRLTQRFTEEFERYSGGMTGELSSKLQGAMRGGQSTQLSNGGTPSYQS
jgi:hemerythrin superfamily protein